MMTRPKLALLSSAMCASLLVASAYAQQPVPTPPAAPSESSPATPAPRADRGPGPGPGRMDRGRGPERFSAEDRAAFFDARLAAIRTGLKLSADQEKLWPPVESAVRDMVKQAMEGRAQREAQPPTTDPVERMARMGDFASKRGGAMTRLAEAARPLYASLDDSQKRRLRVLMGSRGGDGPLGMMERRGDMRGMEGRPGEGRRGEGMRGDHPHRMADRDADQRGFRGREDDRGGWNNWGRM